MNRFVLAWLFLSLLLWSGCAYKVATSTKHSLSSAYMVASAHPLATEAGLNILADGGTAMDAAVAVAYALSVVYPRAGNIGGGGFMVYRTNDGHSFCLDFREKAPDRAHKDMYLDSTGNVIPGKSLYGAQAVGVPGTVHGLEEAHARFGTMPFESLLQPAISYAKKGFRIGQHEADRLNKYAEDIGRWNEEAIPFIKDEPWRHGDRLKQKQLAGTLETISKSGRSAFYDGILSQSLVTFLGNNDGIISTEDLRNYKSIWREPLIFDYKEYTLHTMPLPSSGGMTLGQILSAIESHELMGFQTPEDVHLILEAERRAYAMRASHLGDPDFVSVPVDMLMDKRFIQDKMGSFQLDEATRSEALNIKAFDVDLEGFETTHFSIVDQYGNAVALTTTLNSNYGSKLYFPEGGFFLNNQMDDFSAKPGIPNQYGLVGNAANAIEPGKRMLSSMTPTIIEKDGALFLLLGSPGGSTIITTVLQVFLNVAEYNLSLEDAIAAPRFHHQWLPDKVFHEEGLSSALMNALQDKGHTLTKKKSIGLVDACLIHPDGTITGGADPRGEDDARGKN